MYMDVDIYVNMNVNMDVVMDARSMKSSKVRQLEVGPGGPLDF